MKTAFACLALCALITSCGSARSASSVKAIGLLPGTIHLQSTQARDFALALASAGIMRQGADIGGFFIRADSISCDGDDACQIAADGVEHQAPSAAAATIVATLKSKGATSKVAATGISCVTYINPRVSPGCTMTLVK